MLIECLIQSEGPTHFTASGFIFEFKENEHGHKVCQVDSRAARERMLSLPDFRVYDPPEEYMTEVPAFRGPSPNPRKRRVRNADRAAAD
jgi:hypothetical protein